MKRINETFSSYPVGSQYVADAQAVAVGRIADDGSLDYHPGYHRHAALFELMAAGRQPSCDLSGTAPGQAVNARITFRHYGTGLAGHVLDMQVKLTTGPVDIIRFGYDGGAWYCYVCAPSRIQPGGAWSLNAPLDDAWHTFGLAVRHNRIVGQLDDNPGFNIPYTCAYSPAGTHTAAVLLESSATWGIRYKSVDGLIGN